MYWDVKMCHLKVFRSFWPNAVKLWGGADLQSSRGLLAGQRVDQDVHIFGCSGYKSCKQLSVLWRNNGKQLFIHWHGFLQWNGETNKPSVGFAGWSLLMAVWMLLKDAGGAHCCRTPMALQNWSASWEQVFSSWSKHKQPESAVWQSFTNKITAICLLTPRFHTNVLNLYKNKTKLSSLAVSLR